MSAPAATAINNAVPTRIDDINQRLENLASRLDNLGNAVVDPMPAAVGEDTPAPYGGTLQGRVSQTQSMVERIELGIGKLEHALLG